MKNRCLIFKCVAAFLLWQASANMGSAYTGTGTVEHVDQAATWLYQGKAYDALMPETTLEDSPDFDIANPQLRTPLKDVIAVGYAGLNQFTKTTNGWEVSSINLRACLESRFRTHLGIPEMQKM